MMSAGDALLGLAGLLLLYGTAQLFGKAVELLPSLVQKKDAAFRVTLPAFLGMLLAGMLVANLPGGLTSRVPTAWSQFIRKAVLGVILARAGLSMDVDTLRQKSLTTLCLATLPCSAEALSAACLLRLLMSPAPSWALCFSLGFVLSSVSPAVVVPSLVALQDEGYGVKKGIPTMVLAAASLDDIISICGFGVSFNLAFSQIDDSRGSSVAMLVLNAPISLIGGFLIGFTSAFCQHSLTSWAVSLAPGVLRAALLAPLFRGGLLLAVSVAVVFALDLAGFSAGGYLAVMVQACALATWWNQLHLAQQQKAKEGEKMSLPVSVPVSMHVSVLSKQQAKWESGREQQQQQEKEEKEEKEDVSAVTVSTLYKTLWFYTQPALFMLIGAEVLFRNISASSLQIAAIILLLCTSLRLLVTYLSVCTSAVLLTRERLFVCLAWLPKATVQAALGSLVLDAAKELEIDDDGVASETERVGEVVLTLAVLAILVTAPIGAVGIFVAGPRWLEREEEGKSGGAVQEAMIPQQTNTTIDKHRRGDVEGDI